MFSHRYRFARFWRLSRNKHHRTIRVPRFPSEYTDRTRTPHKGTVSMVPKNEYYGKNSDPANSIKTWFVSAESPGKWVGCTESSSSTRLCRTFTTLKVEESRPNFAYPTGMWGYWWRGDYQSSVPFWNFGQLRYATVGICWRNGHDNRFQGNLNSWISWGNDHELEFRIWH